MKIVVYALILSFMGLAACSSQNDGSSLPAKSFDSIAPKVERIDPPETEGNFVATNSIFQFYYNELLDIPSLEDQIKLTASKTRSIYETAQLGFRDFNVYEQDERSVSILHQEELYTSIREEVIRTDIDENGVEQRETRTIIEELPRSVVTIVPEGRLALWSLYSLKLESGIKDISQIESFSPVDGSPTTGNFAAQSSLQFGTEDGAWRQAVDVNDAYLSSGYEVGALDYVSDLNTGLVFWVQQSTGANGFSHLFVRAFDQDSQTLASSSQRIDYISAIDGPSNVSDNVLAFASDAELANYCVAWVYQESVMEQGVYARCGSNSIFFDRVAVASHSTSEAVQSLEVYMVDDEFGYVTYLYEGAVYAYLFSVNDVGSVTILDSQVFGGATVEISEFAGALRSFGQGVELNIVYSAFESDLPISEQYSVGHVRYLIDTNRELTIVSQVIERSGSAFQALSSGYDYLGRGFAAWSRGSGIARQFYTANYSGVSWVAPVGVLKDGRGPIVDGSIFVFEDGQALFSWVQEVNGSYQVKVQGQFPNDPDFGFVRPSVLEIRESFSQTSGIQVIGDREGNAIMLFHDSSSTYAVRFRQNIEWDNAWGDPVRLGNYSGSSPRIEMILSDGRIALTDKEWRDGYDAFLLRLFSDFD